MPENLTTVSDSTLTRSHGLLSWCKIFIFGLLINAFIGTVPSHALIVDLDAYVDMSILGPDGVTPIADGSWVFIIGSGDAIQDPMASVGTNLIANSVTGDDVILGAIQIPFNSIPGTGMFFATVQYESDDINYTYIRFFDSTGQLTGPLYWGTSTMFQLGVTLGVSTVQYDQNTQLVATNLNNFIIIPEPSTANLFVVVAGMLWAMRRHRAVSSVQVSDVEASSKDDPA